MFQIEFRIWPKQDGLDLIKQIDNKFIRLLNECTVENNCKTKILESFGPRGLKTWNNHVFAK